MNWDKFQQVRAHIELSKDWQRFVPAVSYDGRDGDSWDAIKVVDATTRGLVQAMQQHVEHLEQSGDYTPEAIERKRVEFYEKEIQPKLEMGRKSALSEFRSRALSARAETLEKATNLPEHPLMVGLALKDLDLVREGLKAKGKDKLTIVDVERLPIDTRQLIAVAPAHVTGLRPEDHARIKEQVHDEIGGHEYASADALVGAVEAVGNLIDYAQVKCEDLAGIKRSHPTAEAGREFAEKRGIPNSEPIITVADGGAN